MTKLKRLKQCDKCPWKVSTNTHDIPSGYSVERHHDLKKTIADPHDVMGQMMSTEPLHAMSCHEHPDEDQAHCVGWLYNQLGVGNNLRLRMARLENAHLIKVDGPQHETLEDTFPENKGL